MKSNKKSVYNIVKSDMGLLGASMAAHVLLVQKAVVLFKNLITKKELANMKGRPKLYIMGIFYIV